jgi:Fe-S-cluster-containing dehydrogenase component
MADKPVIQKRKRKKKGVPPSFPRVSETALSSISLFDGLSQADLALLKGKVHRASAKAGEQIIELPPMDEPFTHFFFLAVGQVSVNGLDSDARERPLNFLRKGDFFVNKSFQWNQQIATNVTAITDSELLLVPKDAMKQLVDQNEQVYKDLKTITERVDYRNRIYSEDGQALAVLDFLVETGLTQASRVKITQLDLCIACDTCYDACEERHGFQRLERGYAKFGILDFAKSCLTCFYPTCIPSCPVDSVVYNEEKGEVEILDNCIGCTSCAQACQYGAITLHKVDEEDARFSRFITEDKKRPPKVIADKCNHCYGYDDMACITHCPTDAIIEVNSADLLDNPRIFGLGAGAMDPRKSLTRDTSTDARLQGLYITLAAVATAFLAWEALSLKYASSLSILFNMQLLRWIPPSFDLSIRRGSDLCILLGNIGFFLLMIAMLYPMRKAFPKLFKHLGQKPRWLDLHNFCGFMGCVLISFHTGFEFGYQGATFGYFALIAVMLSGFFGRFLYQMIPRGVAGTELQMRDIENEDSVLGQRMDALLQHSKSLQEMVNETMTNIIGDEKKLGFRKMLRSFVVTPGAIRKLLRTLRQTGNVHDSDLAQLKELLEEKLRLKRNVAYLDTSAVLFQKWQWIHRPFAYIMGTLAILHIVYNLIYFNWT